MCLFSTPLFPTSSGCVSISGVSVFNELASAMLNTTVLTPELVSIPLAGSLLFPVLHEINHVFFFHPFPLLV